MAAKRVLGSPRGAALLHLRVVEGVAPAAGASGAAGSLAGVSAVDAEGKGSLRTAAAGAT